MVMERHMRPKFHLSVSLPTDPAPLPYHRGLPVQQGMDEENMNSGHKQGERGYSGFTYFGGGA